MRFTGLGLTNWRNFRSVDVGLERRTFLVGPNAAGKSNLLDALRFLHDVVTVGGGFQEAVDRRGGVSAIRCLLARRPADVSITVDLTVNGDDSAPWRYSLSFSQDNLRRPIIRQERVSRPGKDLLTRPDDADQEDPALLRQTHLEQLSANQEFRQVAEAFKTVSYLHLVPQLIREPDRSVGRTGDPFGGDFLEQLARLQKSQPRIFNSRMQRIRDALRVAVPQLKELDLQRDPVRGTPHLRGLYEHWRPKAGWQSEDQFSDGTLRLLGLLWALLEGTGPLLLEEPELSLHPEVVRFIPQMMARLQRRTGRQVLVSTHSTDLLSDPGIGSGEVLLLEPTPLGTKVEPARSLKKIKQLLDSGLTMADVVIPHSKPANIEQLGFFGES